MAIILRYFSEFAYLLGILCRSSRSLSHLLMSSCSLLLWYWYLFTVSNGWLLWEYQFSLPISDCICIAMRLLWVAFRTLVCLGSLVVCEENSTHTCGRRISKCLEFIKYFAVLTGRHWFMVLVSTQQFDVCCSSGEIWIDCGMKGFIMKFGMLFA